MKTRRTLAKWATAILGVITLSTSPGTVIAQLDQHDDESDGFGSVPLTFHSLLFFDPAGQEFTPTLNSLNYVNLRTQDFQQTNNAVPAQLYVTILEPTPSGGGQQTAAAFLQNPLGGTVIGQSLIVTLQPGFGQSSLLGGLTTFNFSSAVPLTPGTPYALQVHLLTAGNWAFLDNAGSPPFYSNVTYYAGGGNGFILGNPNFAPEFDLYFQEGMTVPEPSTIALIGTGLLGLLIRHRRR
jgi:hypothetical protein